MNKTYKFWVLLATVLIIGCISLFFWRYLPAYNYQAGVGIYPVRLLSDQIVWDANWSPDGERIAMITTKRRDQTSPTKIYLYDWEEETLEWVPAVIESSSKGEEFYAMQIDWSPDGKTLAVSGIPTDPQKQGIWLINLENFGMRFLTKGESLSWSPAGDQIAVMTEPDAKSLAIKIVDLQKAKEIPIIEFQYQGSSTLMDLNWSPGGDLLVFTVPGENANGYRLDGLYVLKVDNSDYFQILKNSSWSLYSPVWLPTGEWLAFVAYTSEGGIVAVAPATGECLYAWLPQIRNADWVDVSPDGRNLLVISSGDLYIIDIETAVGSHLLPDQLHCP